MKAQLKMHNGTPTVFVDDQPSFFSCHLVGYRVPDKLQEHQPYARRYAEAGIHVYSVDSLTHEWVGPRPDNASHYDFTLVGPRLESYIEVDPEAKFLLRVGLDTKSAPSSWLWLYAAGLLNTDDGNRESEPRYRDHMHDLTGLRFGQGDSPWGPLMHVTNFRHPITKGLPQDWFWGSTIPIGPLFHPEDPEATTLSQVVYSLGRCKPGFGVKMFNANDPSAAWSSVYMASPDVPAPVLRGIARWAGVHLYNEDGDVLYATPELLSVHSVAGGPRTFTLQKRAEVVYDLLNECVVARDTAQFRVELPPASTSLYFTGRASLAP